MKNPEGPRRTLKYIDNYPAPGKLYEIITESPGWPYKMNKEYYRTRDQALCSITYLLAGRISEILRLNYSQFTKTKTMFVINSIKLSKTRKKGQPRKHQFRPEAFLPFSGERAQLTMLVSDYLRLLAPKEDLFPIGRTRAWQIIETVTGFPCHWLRAFGENYLYDNWDKDLLAVADYIKVDPQTLGHYIRASYKKYRPV